MTRLYTRGFKLDMKVSTVLTLISLFETKMEISQEIIASFYEMRFLESENQAVKKASYNFQTSNTWHKSCWKASLFTLPGQEEGQAMEKNLS